jgi:hypothetical protein
LQSGGESRFAMHATLRRQLLDLTAEQAELVAELVAERSAPQRPRSHDQKR